MKQLAFNEGYPTQEIGKVVTPEEIGQVIKQLLGLVNSGDNQVRIQARDKFFSHLYALDFYDHFIETTIGMNFSEFEQSYFKDSSKLIPEEILTVISNYIDQIKPSFELTPSKIIGTISGLVRSKGNSVIDSIKGFFRR